MKRIVKILYILISLIFLLYLSLPNSGFPSKLYDAYQSDEPADIEDINRKGYYTQLDRKNIIDFYFRNWSPSFYKIKLNYPPEDSQTLIRDQTRSTYLEEQVILFRQSIYINGFEPKEDKDKIIINGKSYNQKVIVKMVESNVITRMMVGIFTIGMGYLIAEEWRKNLIKINLRK